MDWTYVEGSYIFPKEKKKFSFRFSNAYQLRSRPDCVQWDSISPYIVFQLIYHRSLITFNEIRCHLKDIHENREMLRFARLYAWGPSSLAMMLPPFSPIVKAKLAVLAA
jgi:hypothetical protein